MKKINIVVFLFITLFSVHMNAQQNLVPVSLQYSFLVKMPMFINNFSASSSDCITVGIIYQSKYKMSSDLKNELNDIISKNGQKSLRNLPLKCKHIDLNENSNFAEGMKNCDIIYITPVKAVSVKDIASTAAKMKVLTVTGVVDYLDDGVVTAFDLLNNKPKIKINTGSAKESDIKFSAELIKLAILHE